MKSEPARGAARKREEKKDCIRCSLRSLFLRDNKDFKELIKTLGAGERTNEDCETVRLTLPKTLDLKLVRLRTEWKGRKLS
jgi:hypothetical protein